MAKRQSGLTQQQEEFASWLLLTKRQRQLHGLPLTQGDWAKQKGVTPRTVSRWKDKENFQQFLEQRRVELARQAPNATVAPQHAYPATDHRVVDRLKPADVVTEADDPLHTVSDPRERAYLEAKQALLAGVRAGEKGAIDAYFKWFGAEFVEAEKAGSERLVDMDDDQLVGELVKLLGADRVAEALAVSAARS